MPDTSPIIHRAQKRLSAKLQDGTVLACTTLAHPPSRMGHHPRHIALIQLEDQSRIIAPLTAPLPIGSSVHPRMRLQSVNAEGLRIYDVSFESLQEKTAPMQVFPGYILALTGPTGVGRTTVSRLLLRMTADYAEAVPILKTCERRMRKDERTHCLTKRAFTELKRKGEIVAMAHATTDGDEECWYGYRASDIERIWKKGKLPVVITETHLLQELAAHYGRRSLLSFGLLPPGRSKRTMLSHLLRRLLKKGDRSEEFIRRSLKHAESELAFLRERKDLFDRILVNGDLDTVVASLRKHLPTPESSGYNPRTSL